MPITTILFDFGGVLLRMADETPRRQLAERYRLPLAEIYRQVFETESARRGSLGEIPIEQHWLNVAAALGLPAADLPEFIQQFWAADALDGELVAYLRRLRPRFKIGLLSNAWNDLRDALATRFDIAGDFDELIISAEVGLAKPDPRIYHLALQRLAARPDETVFLDDMPANVQAARAAGLHAIEYRDFQQARAALEQLL